ncbi:hypothetical protein T265_00475 [Opisthorchis viverrini]|uniref:Uncharacterized protein n=1 Tax=Opisthorchis viverrini TaxID=6198 RepID=A0A075A377_OPIVI|nr:hypothetical protein T265_00475 [Opisthorchis viverrini]KER33816.1 hypothetical protein T265_00475 [Opisthorchis viverrini]
MTVKPFSCSTLSVPSHHATRRLHEGWDTARLPKPTQGKSRGRGRVRTTDLPVIPIMTRHITPSTQLGQLLGRRSRCQTSHSHSSNIHMFASPDVIIQVLPACAD